MRTSVSTSSFRMSMALAASLALAGCASSPIGVKRMDPDAVARSITANALTENRPSIDSSNVLHRYGLFDQFRKKPAEVLARLHRIAVETDDEDTWFALAELSFLHADRTRDHAYSAMSAIYAWSFLFGAEPPEPFDPRLRVATDLYNRGLTQALEVTKDRLSMLSDLAVDLPIGRLEIDFDESTLDWNGRHLHDFVPVAELEVHGLNNRFRTPGIGAPLAASAAVTAPSSSHELLAPRLKTPVTALVRFHDLRRQIAEGRIDAVLELHTDPNEQSVEIDGRTVPLEKEPSAVLAAMVAEAPVIKEEFLAFLGSLTQKLGEGGLGALRPHVRGRTPVVFVHGTASSPARWAEMVNVLDNDPRINQRFEPWFFTYNSSSPIGYSSYLLRKALKDAVAKLDPEGTDTELRNMVVIGHSQGGLLTKMTSVSTGDIMWKNISSKPFEEIRVSSDYRELLREVIFVEPLDFVKRVVFICTPHRGSFLAAKGIVRSLITRLVSLPATVTSVTTSMLTLNPDEAGLKTLSHVNAVDNMSPTNRFVRVLAGIPLVPGVTAHSIVAVKTDGPIEEGNDGVVEYKSAHIDGVASEFIVHSGHSTQAVPETIEEVRRILLLHAEVSSPAATPSSRPSGSGARPGAGKGS